MPFTFPSSALRGMSSEERDRLLESAFTAPGEGLPAYLAVLDARLRVFEQRYELSSADLPSALAQGTLRETTEVSDWLFWAALRSQLARETRA
ncbi:MAG: hypothetical protein IPI92_17510 [Gemmatimonadetes bacterium]|nr:hypothetical protein [Gemmatimonadota bacterium]